MNILEVVKIGDETFEILESGEEHTLPEIAKKLKANQALNQVEAQMASACIVDWLRIKEAQIKGGAIGGKAKVPKGFGIKKFHKPKAVAWTPEKLAQLHELRRQGLTIKQIGERFKISESFVSKLLKR